MPIELLDILLKRPDFHPFDYLASYFIRFNVTREPFNNPKVRQALAMAIDKERIVTRITKAGEKIANSLTPPGIPGYTPPAGLEYNPALARKLLAEAGYPDGQGFPTFQYMFNAAAGGSAKTHQKIGIELRDMWQKNLGIHTEMRQVESKVLYSAQTALDYQVCRSSWVGDYNDPNTFLDLFLSHGGNTALAGKIPPTINSWIRPVHRRHHETIRISCPGGIIVGSKGTSYHPFVFLPGHLLLRLNQDSGYLS